MIVLTRAELDREGCAKCGAVHPIITVQPACHPDAGLLAAYQRPEGVLHLACVECMGPVAMIAVGDYAGARH